MKASFDRIVFPRANLISLRILPIKEIVVRDRHTVEMKLSEPRDSYTFLALLAGGWNVITSKKALDQHKGDLKRRQLPGHRALHAQDPHHRVMGAGQ